METQHLPLLVEVAPGVWRNDDFRDKWGRVVYGNSNLIDVSGGVFNEAGGVILLLVTRLDIVSLQTTVGTTGLEAFLGAFG